MDTKDTSREPRPQGAVANAATDTVARAASVARDQFTAATAVAGEVADQARQAASDAAASVSGQVKQFLDEQVSGGATMVGHFAGSMKRAADDLDRDAPQLASFVRTFGEQVDGYAENLRGQSVEQLVRSASDFTRRQPALVFGLAALAGFVALRAVKSAQPVTSPPTQPGYPGD
jgi:hypothetical protein